MTLKKENVYQHTQAFPLDSGQTLQGFELSYTTLGELNATRDNVIWICHPFTGSSDPTSWWGDFFKDPSPFDSKRYFIVCANVLGGCYGSTGPLSTNPHTGEPYYHDFPAITTRDAIRSFDLLRKQLGIKKIHTLLGCSLGGQQALEWAIEMPSLIKNLILVASNAQHSPWGIAINEAQRMAIEADISWKTRNPRAGINGMKAARAFAMTTFRSYECFKRLQYDTDAKKLDDFKASSYQRYQGNKLTSRFNAFSYWTLTKMMDNHHVGRNRGSIEQALQIVRANTLVVGIEGDLLFPIEEQKFLAEHILVARLTILNSFYGHDSFLAETEKVKDIIEKFLYPHEAVAQG